MNGHQVRIDGKETTLRYDGHSFARGYAYLTPGNAASHAFPFTLAQYVGRAFTTGGHRYEVLT